MLPFAKLYFTPRDVQKGAQWYPEIVHHLRQCVAGILCITRDNLREPWILFEAGALAMHLARPCVCPLLFDVDDDDLPDPMRQFQATSFNRADMWRLVQTINNLAAENRLINTFLESAFNHAWPDLERQVRSILARHGRESTPVPRGAPPTWGYEPLPLKPDLGARARLVPIPWEELLDLLFELAELADPPTRKVLPPPPALSLGPGGDLSGFLTAKSRPRPRDRRRCHRVQSDRPGALYVRLCRDGPIKLERHEVIDLSASGLCLDGATRLSDGDGGVLRVYAAWRTGRTGEARELASGRFQVVRTWPTGLAIHLLEERDAWSSPLSLS